MSSNYREPINCFTAEWELPAGYYVGSIQFQRWHEHKPVSVYLCYEAREELKEGKHFLIASGHRAEGDDFHEALLAAKAKVDASLEKQRDVALGQYLNPPVARGTSGKADPLASLDIKLDLNL